MTGHDPLPPPTRAFAQAMAGASVIEQRATPAAAFQRAREGFRSGERLDMARLANELGIARATLYRWTGDRNRLLGDVARAEVETLIRHFDHNTPGRGIERFNRIAGDFLDAIASNPGLTAFLALEGDAGLRLITAPTGAVRPRIVTALAELIQREVDTGRYTAPDDPRLIADGIVSLGERFLYNGGDRTMNPDPQTAKRIIGLLLREPGDVRNRSRSARRERRL
jgi:AcrR family transcriptional regulator